MDVALAWGYPVLVVFTGYLVLGITGFGSALVIVPLLAWRWPLPEVVALTLLLDVPTSAWFGGLNLKQVSREELVRLLPGVVLGLATGIWLQGSLAAHWPLLLLGLFVAWAGLNALRKPKITVTRWPALAVHPTGWLAGTVQAMFGTAGPVFLVWLQHRLTDVREVRATTPVLMVLAGAAVLAARAAQGQLSEPDLWQRWAALIVVALLAVTLGHRLSRHVPAMALRRAVCLLLVASGMMLVLRALLA